MIEGFDRLNQRRRPVELVETMIGGFGKLNQPMGFGKLNQPCGFDRLNERAGMLGVPAVVEPR